MRPEQVFHQLAANEIEELREYIVHRSGALDRDLLPFGDPADKDVLVFGSGYGADALWAAKRGARSIVATDTSRGLSPVPFEQALDQLEIKYENYEFRREDVYETAVSGDTFDLVISNGTFEHVHDLKGVLSAFRPMMRPGGRIAIFADGLWYSSIGGHLGRGPWEHLWAELPELKANLPGNRWAVYREQLNRMTAVDFLEAVRSVGMLILQMRLNGDPNVARLPALSPRIQAVTPVSPADLSVVSIGCELCFLENL